MTLKRAVSWTFHKLIWFSAILLVMAAVLLSLLRYGLPYFPDLTKPLERQVSASLGQQVHINQLALSWRQQGPAIELSNFKLGDAAADALSVDVDRLWVVIDFWESLTERQWVLQQFILEQADIQLDVRRLTQGDGSSVQLDQVEQLFLSQLESFSFQQSTLQVTPLSGNPRTIDIERLTWSNRGRTHQGVGQFRVKNFTPNRLNFVLQLEGRRWRDMVGQFYVDSRGIDVSPWLEKQVPGIDITDSNVNFTAWLDIYQGQVSQALLRILDNRLTMQRDNRVVDLHIPSGEVQMQRQGQGWLINSAPMTVEVENNTLEWPAMRVQNVADTLRASVEGVPASKLIPVLQLIDDEGRLYNYLQSAGLDARANLFIQDSAQFPWHWRAELIDINASGSADIPAFSPLSMTLEGNLKHLQWTLNAPQLTVTSDRLSEQRAWQLKDVELNGTVEQIADGWQVTWRESQLAINDMQLSGRGAWRSVSALQPAFELVVASRQPFAVDTLKSALPDVMGEDLKRYLSNALKAGTVEQLTLAWRAQQMMLPSQVQEGVFSAGIHFDTLTYQFQPNWPAIQELPLTLDFYQHGLAMHATQGRINGVTIEEVNAQIPDLLDAGRGLQVESKVAGPAQSVRSVFQQSPLTSVAEVFNQVMPENRISGQFNLDIPFDGSREVGVNVKADLANNRVYIDAIDQWFDVRSGQLIIDDQQVTTKDLVLAWFGRPFSSKIVGAPKQDSYQLSIENELDWQLEPLFKALPKQGWSRYFYGAVNGIANIDLDIADQVKVTANSQLDLTGLESRLPQPLNKEFGENWQLDVSLKGNGNDLALDVRSGERLRWRSAWQPGVQQWQYASLSIGQPSALPEMNTQATFDIRAYLPELAIGHWYDLLYFISDSFANSGASDADREQSLSAWYLPDSIRIKTDELSWGQQSFSNADIDIFPQDRVWQARILADQLSVRAQLPEDFLSEPIKVSADFAQLNTDNLKQDTSSDSETTDYEWVSRVPPLDITCNVCRLDDHHLGRVSAKLVPIEGGIALNQLKMANETEQLDASGFWMVSEGQPFTQLSGELTTSDIGELLREYGLETAIRDSSATIAFGVRWNDHPHQVDFDTLSGALQWDFGQGYLAEVSDGGARLFSLLSLDGILRKLTLDFRDVFSQGMFYTDLNGSVQIAQGVLTTNDTQLFGSAGDMVIRGSTDLEKQSLDYELTYAPKVTSSLPVILAWMVNPPSGLAALLIDKVLQDAKVISLLRYRVTGTIDNPVVEEVERDSRPVDIPELEKEKEANNDATSTQRNPTQ
ncbi:YhdP family protein [Idiomarina sp. UBA3162]|uniref:YhdP family protein n=1 Tax=Idiomarina sp. UBA3162 TaxID=1946641 RepID=UPI000C8D4FB1|nr:YhdP family protein [Idiomarina sp. UBA3162]MAD52657.1 TIGR02099 family protein [Idiomarinaceae bacterium]